MKDYRNSNQKALDDAMDEKFGSFTNMTVPTHTHNHVDAPPVVMGDLGYDSRGLRFPFPGGVLSIVADPGGGPGGNPQAFDINPPTAFDIDLTIGNVNPFSSITAQGRDILLAVFGLTDQSDFEMTEDHVRFGSTSAGWYAHLPVDDFASLPASPLLGDIAYASTDGGLTGNLYVCQSPGVWTLK